MVAADTSRSRAYLQALARNEMLPNYVIVLESTSDKTLPGQLDKSQSNYESKGFVEVDECWIEAQFDSNLPLKILLDDIGVRYEVAKSRDINDPAVVDIIRQRPEEVFIYSGFGGTILRDEVLSLGINFLHVHGGYLPDFKGSTTNYYSLIIDGSVGASALFLNKKIDSGSILLRHKYPPPVNRQVIDHIYDSGARAKVLVMTLKRYLECGFWDFVQSANDDGEIYYIIHPVLKHIAILDKGNDK